ncbi:MAG: hypothetical protein ACLSU9_10880 [Anaerovoracaceae bacterium]
MYWCDNCKAFHESEMIKYIEEAHGEVFKVCGHCGSEEIEPADICTCGEPKRETEDYCEYCTPQLKNIAETAIKMFKEITNKTSLEAKEELIRWLEYEI